MHENPAKALDHQLNPELLYGRSHLKGDLRNQTLAWERLARMGNIVLEADISHTFELIFPHWASHIAERARGSEDLMSDQDRTILRILSDKIDELTDLTPEQKTWVLENKEEFSESVIDLSNTIREDETLDEAFKKHVGDLLDHIADCLNRVEQGGLFDLGDSLFKLEVYIQSALVRTGDDEVRSKVYEFMMKYLRPFAAETGRAFLNAGVQKMLEG